MNRAELHAEALRLRAQNRPAVQVAKMLGISTSAYRDLITDPDGSKARARKDSYRKPCPKCGTPMDGSGGWEGEHPSLCITCNRAEQAILHKVWAREAIIKAFRKFRRATGRTPTAADSNRSPSMVARFSPERRAEIAANTVRLPHPNIVKKEFGSWGAAVKAAGLPPNKTGGAAHRSGKCAEARKRKEKA